MQLRVITDNKDLYSEVHNVIQHLDGTYELRRLSSLDDVVSAANGMMW